jgi:DNA-binding MarR family transcriptional regulator
MSSDRRGREELVGRVMSAIRVQADQSDRLDQLASSRFGMNRTDGRAIEILSRLGPMTAKQLATHLGMTTGGVTTVIDRIEKAGYVRRRHDGEDRRRVMLETTPLQAAREKELFGALIARTGQYINSLSDQDLVVVGDFLEKLTGVVGEHIDHLDRGGRSRKRRA